MIEAWIYCYHLDKFFNLPTTPNELPNTYATKFTVEEVMNRTAPKASFSGSGPRTLNINLSIHSQLFALDNPESPSITKDLIKALIACSYPGFNFETSEIVPPMVLMKFGEAASIRGVINSGINVTFSEPWLKDGTLAMANINFTVTEIDQFSAEYISKFGANIPIPTDLKRRR